MKPERSAEMSRAWTGRLRWLSLLTLVVAAVLGIFFTRHWRVVNDAAQLRYCVFMVEHGFAPYRQLFEMNMPGIYMLYWGVLHTLGSSDVAWRIFDLTLGALATLGMVVIARGNVSSGRDWFAGVFGGVLFALFHARDGAGQMAQRDLILAVLLVLGYASLFAALRRDRWWLMFGFGLCLGGASTIKPTPMPFALVLLALAILRWRTLQLRRWGSAMLAGVAGIILPLGAVVLYLHHYRAGSAFVHILRTVLPYYAPLANRTLGALSTEAMTPSLMTLLPLACIVALLRRDTWKDWEHGMVLLGLFFGMASFCAQHKGFNYHRYPMLAFAFLWAGMMLAGGLREHRNPLVHCIAVAGIVFGSVTSVLYAAKARRIHWPEAFETALTADLNRIGGTQLSGKVQCLSTLAECDTTLYRMGIVQSTGLMYDFFLFGEERSAPVQEARAFYRDATRQNPPEVVVAGLGSFPAEQRASYAKLNEWPELSGALTRDYDLIDEQQFAPGEGGPLGFRLYVRRQALHNPR